MSRPFPIQWMLNALFCLLVTFSIWRNAAAQSGHQPYFRNYSTADGLASPEVHDILQDKQGYIWIATDNGVSRFDGYSFKNYGAKEGLNNNVVFFLQEDPQGKIWMQTLSGNVYYFYQDSIYAYPYNAIFQQYSSNIPNGFLISEKDWSYFSLLDIGIIKIDPQGQHEIINAREPVAALFLEKAEFSRGLYSFVSSASLKKFGFNPGGPAPNLIDLNNPILGIFTDTISRKYNLNYHSGNSVTNGFSDGDVQMIDIRRELVILRWKQQQARFDLPVPVASFEKIDSAFWLGLNNKRGVWYFKDYNDLIHQQFDEYLSGLSIAATYRDGLEGYWFGSLEKGIFYAPNLDLKVIDFEGFFNTDQVLTLENWRDNRILMGTNTGIIYSLDTAGQIETIYSGNNPIFDLYYRPSDQSIWVASNPVIILDQQTEHLLPFAPDLLLNNYAAEKKFHPTQNDQVLFGSSGYGFDIIDATNKVIINSSRKKLMPERVLAIYNDAEQRIWVGNTRGLFEFKDDELIPPAIDHPAFHLRIEDITGLADGTLVLGTKGAGIVLWKDTTITVIDEAQGLTANMIENLAVDAQQQIWVGTLNGLNVLSRSKEQKDWQVKRWTMSHGLPSNEINDLCAMGKWMYAATSGGIVQLPLVDSMQADRPSPFLEKILINGKPANNDQILHLKFNERNIQLQFVCVNFKFRGNIPYRYRLVSEKNWSYTANRSVNYAALASGPYTFEVQAQNEDGKWSDSLSIPFHIATPFWQKWWFILLITGSLAGLLYYLYRQRISRLKKEAAVDKEISELQRSALQAQMNPHFIFNCLNSIQNFIASGDKQNAMQYLSRFAKLVRTTLHASTQSVISLEEEISVIENYLELEKLRFGKKFEYTIEVDPELDHFETSLPPLLVQPFVENAIIHGFNFTDKNMIGQIYLAYEQEVDQLRITIRDNGIGIYQSRPAGAHWGDSQTSLGMSITKKRLALHHPTPGNQDLQIKELLDQHGAVAGTEIVFRIRL